MDDSVLYKMNLIEVLEEEAQAHGRMPSSRLPEDAPNTWSEKAIRAHFGVANVCPKTPDPNPRALPARFPEAPEEEFYKWFPAYSRLKAPSGTRVAMRAVCLPCAGSAEDMYTSEGTGMRRVPSPLLDFCRNNGVEVLAAQPPGRGMRIREPYSESAQEMAQTLLPLLGPKLQDGTPYVIISHSMGCWIGYELLLRLRLASLPLPLSWFLGAMPCPSIPFEARPWRLQHLLNDEQFKDECRGWDINDAVFQMWAVFEPMLRADFHIFDSYKLQGPVPPPFDNLPIHAFWGTADKRITKEMVQGWKAFTTGPFSCTAIEGNHLWPLQKEPKLRWLQLITDQLACLPTYAEAQLPVK